MPNFHCTVAIPTRELFYGDIAYADVPGAAGHFGVLAGHEMLVSADKAGVLTLWLDAEGNEKKQFALYEGAAQFMEGSLTVLGRFGAAVDDIDVDAVRKKIEKVKAELEQYEAEAAADSENTRAKALAETTASRLGWYETQIKVVEGTLK